MYYRIPVPTRTVRRVSKSGQAAGDGVRIASARVHANKVLALVRLRLEHKKNIVDSVASIHSGLTEVE
jgi:hypothetical protein